MLTVSRETKSLGRAILTSKDEVIFFIAAIVPSIAQIESWVAPAFCSDPCDLASFFVDNKWLDIGDRVVRVQNHLIGQKKLREF